MNNEKNDMLNLKSLFDIKRGRKGCVPKVSGLRNVFKFFGLVGIFTTFFAQAAAAQVFEQGTNAVGLYYQTYWWVRDGGIMEWQGLTNGGMLVWDYGVLNGGLSVGLDLGFNWQTRSNGADFSLANYSLRGGIHPFSFPGVSGSAGDKNDLYGLVKLGVVTEWDDGINGVARPYSRFQWSLAVGNRFFIGSNFFLAIELSLRGLAAGLGVAF